MSDAAVTREDFDALAMRVSRLDGRGPIVAIDTLTDAQLQAELATDGHGPSGHDDDDLLAEIQRRQGLSPEQRKAEEDARLGIVAPAVPPAATLSDAQLQGGATGLTDEQLKAEMDRRAALANAPVNPTPAGTPAPA